MSLRMWAWDLPLDVLADLTEIEVEISRARATLGRLHTVAESLAQRSQVLTDGGRHAVLTVMGTAALTLGQLRQLREGKLDGLLLLTQEPREAIDRVVPYQIVANEEASQ